MTMKKQKSVRVGTFFKLLHPLPKPLADAMESLRKENEGRLTSTTLRARLLDMGFSNKWVGRKAIHAIRHYVALNKIKRTGDTRRSEYHRKTEPVWVFTSNS